MMIKKEIEWHPITERPDHSGSVFLAIKHNGVPDVLMGHYNQKLDKFSEQTYMGLGNTQYQYWAKVEYPEES